jgi:Zn-dependent protease
MLSRHAVPWDGIIGISIDLDLSWFLVFALLIWTLAVGCGAAKFQTWPTMAYWIVGAMTACLRFASVRLHELEHSAVTLRYRTPLRRITLFIFGGVA